MNQHTGKLLIAAGIFIVIAGIALYFFNGYFKWIGKLPGDIRIEKENFRFYFPITTMVIISVIVSLLLLIYRKFS